ncbi:MAG TPA: metalloprotease family protein [Casimicrobiaceae bacterium]|nr:metalloprotease family protein [Casimicrobiaceae bacterium]
MRPQSTSLEPARAIPRRTAWTAVQMPDGPTSQLLMLPASMTMFIAVTVAWVIVFPSVELAIDEWLLCKIAFVVALYYALAALRGRNAEAEVPRGRLIEALVLPPLMLSLLPLIAAAMIGRTSSALVVLSVFNALASGGNAFTAIIVLTQVPRTATLREGDDGLEWRCGATAPQPPIASETAPRMPR